LTFTAINARHGGQQGLQRAFHVFAEPASQGASVVIALTRGVPSRGVAGP